MNRLLWALQGLLAGLFVFAGAITLVTPIEAMTTHIHLPGFLLRLTGAAEILGALGLILPRAVRTAPWLTPLAASGLAVIMAGTTIIGILTGQTPLALLSTAIGLLAAFVAWGRWRIAP